MGTHKLQILLMGYLSIPLFIPGTSANNSWRVAARKRNVRRFFTRKYHLFVKDEKNSRSGYSSRATHSQASRKYEETSLVFPPVFSILFSNNREKSQKYLWP